MNLYNFLIRGGFVNCILRHGYVESFVINCCELSFKSGRGNARSSTSSTSVINSKTHNMTLLVRTNGTQTVPSAGVGATKHLRHKNNNHQNRGLQNPCSPEKVQPRTDERRTLLQRRILTERRAHLSRRRRYVQRSSGGVQYRFTPMQNCAGWTYFQPYPIDCGSCIPVSVRVPQSPQAPAHVYNGPAKTWRGPKLGKRNLLFKFCQSQLVGNFEFNPSKDII